MNLRKELLGLYTENYKISLEIKEDLTRDLSALNSWQLC